MNLFMNPYILKRVDDGGRVAYTVTSCNQVVISSSDRILQYGLIDFFCPQDARKIAETTRFSGLPVANLSGRSMWVPVSRLKYLPFLALALGIFAMVSYPMSIKSVCLFGGKIPAGQVIFPLVFILTDLINELFGYQIAKRCIRYLAFLLSITAVLVKIAVSLDIGDAISFSLLSDATHDEIVRSFDIFYANFPQFLLMNAGSLLIADTFNAYLFARLKHWMQGRQLWVRSLCSNCFASITNSLIFANLIQLYNSQWLGPIKLSSLMATMVFKLPYFIAALPLLYGIRNYIYNQEAKTLADMGDADLLDDHAIRAAERKDYWH